MSLYCSPTTYHICECEQCVSRSYRSKSKTRRSTLHSIPTAAVSDYPAVAVYEPYPDPAQQGRYLDYSYYPANYGYPGEVQPTHNYTTTYPLRQYGPSYYSSTQLQRSSSSQSYDRPSPIEVFLYWRKSRLCFKYLEGEVRTKPGRWKTLTANGYTYYLLESKDYGLTFYSLTWPVGY
ncbi:hypothetical protein F53441_904 [Fusarium austroafricanum]|uniref:Uncharacterized protein n=1 Tax=Fusarium austroafricanum TaxID=2364996 RepID=A0A8H4KUS2_9HYPO|nr:hypothetical protein F53441_904 [Fusarium austroafricanum]